MKKLFTIALALVLTFALVACGCQAKEPVRPTTVPTTMPTTAPSTAPATTAPTTLPTETTEPIMDPTMETNIPDPEVDYNSTEATDVTGETSATEDMGTRSRMRMR